MLREMSQACKEKNVRFIILLMPDNNKETPWPKEIFDNIKDDNIEILDLSRMYLSAFGADPHPNKIDHEWIAWAVAQKITPGSTPVSKNP